MTMARWMSISDPKAPAGKENDWVQTIPGKGWNTLLHQWPVRALVQQDLATERDRTSAVTWSGCDSCLWHLAVIDADADHVRSRGESGHH
jgi:hypothetical protein